jgi:hypothetical protein
MGKVSSYIETHMPVSGSDSTPVSKLGEQWSIREIRNPSSQGSTENKAVSGQCIAAA